MRRWFNISIEWVNESELINKTNKIKIKMNITDAGTNEKI